MFKMRELRGAGIVLLNHVPTELNPADLFTKVLGRQEFEKHRRAILNLPASESVMRQVHDRKAKLAEEGGAKPAKAKKKKIGFKA